MPSPATDSGLTLLKNLQEWAGQKGVPLVSGDVHSHGGAAIDLEGAATRGEDAHLLAILDRTDPYLIAVARLTLDADMIEATVARYEGIGGSEEEIEAARDCMPFVGHIASLEVSIFLQAGAVILKYLFVASWYDDAFGKPSEENSDQSSAASAEYHAEQVERVKWNAAARSDAARRVTLDPRFPKAKSEAARILITREVLGADVPSIEHIVTQIGREAKAIFDLERA